MDYLEHLIEDVINNTLWTYFLPTLLVSAGLYFCARTLLVQIRMIPEMFRSLKEKPSKNSDGEEDISAFKAFTISAASRVGTGNVIGVSLAIASGGPGAVFWMWMIAIIGGATSFVESTLAQLYKVRDAQSYRGGPAYYMTYGLGSKGLAVAFAISITVTYGFIYNAVQANSMTSALIVSVGSETTPLKISTGLILAFLTALVIFGGVRRIATITQYLVPFMASLYLIIGIIVIAMNLPKVPEMFALIIGSALGFREIAGATLGWAFIYGMRRGLFSNEAGMGSAPNAAATASVSHPVKQGLLQTLGVYFDTLVICSITAFIILLADPTEFGKGVDGSRWTQDSLAFHVGSWGIHAVTFILFFLVFSSIIGNYYYGQSNIEFFTQSKAVMFSFRSLVVLCVFFGALGKVSLVWALADTFSAIMVMINLIAIIPLGGLAFALLKNYSQQRAQGLEPVFHRDDLPQAKNVAVWDGSDPITHRSYHQPNDFSH